MFYRFYEQIEARHATMSLHIPVESVSPPYLYRFKLMVTLPVMAHHSLQLSLTLLLFKCCPFIVFSFTAGKAKFNFCPAVFYKVYLQWNQSKAFFVKLTDKFLNFPLM